RARPWNVSTSHTTTCAKLSPRRIGRRRRVVPPPEARARTSGGNQTCSALLAVGERRWILRGPEGDGEFGEAAQHEAVAVVPAQRRGCDGQPHAGEPGEQGGERDQAFQSGQPGAEAVVDAVAEGQM